VSEAAVDRLIAASEALIAALDRHDVEAIERALPEFDESVRQLKSSSDWKRSPELLARLKQARALTSAARTRVRYLADHNRHQLDMLATATGRSDYTPIAYTRPR
jgi:hypothetical protein